MPTSSAWLPVQGGLSCEDPGHGGQHPWLSWSGVAVRRTGPAGRDEARRRYEHDPAAPFCYLVCYLGGEQVADLGHQLGFEVAGLGARRPDDGDIRALVLKAGVAM
jgi:hypothetical protein